jgi:hypothetical protein
MSIGSGLMSFLCRASLLVALWVVTTGHANAYIDGGSAHLLIQGLIAGVAGVWYYFKHPRHLWAALKRLFHRDRQ